MRIQHLKHNEINFWKWDKAIGKAFNGIIYAYSWYLDIVSPRWEALVAGDYEVLMPLPAKNKYGISYLAQPYFTQQLGVFSNQTLTPQIVDDFLKAIPSRFKLIHFNLNIYNKLEKNHWSSKINVTHQLDLIQAYEKCRKNYSTNTRRNIKKAQKNAITIKKDIGIKEFLTFKQRHTHYDLGDENFATLEQLFARALKTRQGQIYSAFNATGKLCAAAFFMFSHQKAIYLISASSDEGKEQRAMFLLIDTFIRDYSGRSLTLDFEGSKIAGIARFFKGFGGKPAYFLSIEHDRLPWYVRLLKKTKTENRGESK